MGVDRSILSARAVGNSAARESPDFHKRCRTSEAKLEIVDTMESIPNGVRRPVVRWLPHATGNGTDLDSASFARQVYPWFCRLHRADSESSNSASD